MPHRDDLYIDEIDLNLGAGSEYNHSVSGRHCRLKAVSVPGTELAVETDTGVLFTMGVGDRFEAPFGSLKVTAAIAVVATFVLGDGKTESDAAVVSIAGATFTPDILNTIAGVADVAIGAGAAANVSVARATKRFTVIKNKSGNTDSFRIGGAAVAAAKGVELEPGESITVPGSMLIRAFNTGAGAQSLSVTEIDFV